MIQDTPGGPVPAQILAEQQVQPREIELFMFSAATWLTHRIHFDRDYARTEGHPDLVVHGPLQGAYLAELLSALAARHGGTLAGLSYRMHRSAYCGDQLTLRATLSSVTGQEDGLIAEVAVTIHGADGQLVTSGQGRLRLPAGAGLPVLAERPDPDPSATGGSGRAGP
jgi:hydroxyacyl-ACP dehydratase HTD2-like protein with hotdog domain